MSDSNMMSEVSNLSCNPQFSRKYPHAFKKQSSLLTSHLLRALLFTIHYSLFTCLLLSCSQTEPRIPFGFIELVYYQDSGGPLERFSFFIIAEDDDGIENLGDLYLYNDYEQLRWHISSDEWVTYTESGNTWIGTRSIANLENDTLPRGQYRAVLVNKGGERAERLITFDAPAAARLPFPSLEISEGQYTVNSLYPVNRLVCYDESGNYLVTVTLDSLAGSMGDLSVPDNARTAALWAQDSQFFTSAFTNVASIQR